MSEVVEVNDDVVEEKVVKPDYKVRLSEKYAIGTDPRNIILLERYGKRSGKGKDAPIIDGEFGWKELGYFQNLDDLADWLVKHEMFTTDGVSELKHYANVIEKLKDEISNTLVEKVVVKLS